MNRGAEGTSPPARRAIFAAFLRLGLTAFGGPAMVAYIRDLAVTKKGWLTAESFQEGVALCQSVPGATAMQAAAYAGLRARGFWGAAAAYVGFGLPAFLFMLALSAAYGGARDLPTVTSAFRGLQVIVVALVANATFNFGKASVKGWRDGLLAAAAAACFWSRGNPVLVVAGAAAASLLLYRGAASESVPSPPAQPRRAGERWAGARAAAALAAAALACLGLLFLVDRRLFSLAALMIKVDLFAFGGGFASLPLLLHEVVEVRQWLDARTFLDAVALGQVTPGPIVITATFVGYQLAGLAGAVVATAAIFTPSLVVLVAAVPHLDALRHSPLVRRALRGVLASFVGLLLAVTLRFGTSAPWSFFTAALGGLAFAALRLKVDILWVVLGGTLVSACLL